MNSKNEIIKKYKKIRKNNLSSEQLFKLNELLLEKTKQIYIDKKFVKVHSNINIKEGRFISSIVKKYKLKKCLEVGMAFGISAMYITNTFPDVSLISIDPFQSTQWKSMGVKLLENTKLNDKHTLIEKKSYIALPELLEKYGEGSFDFIFIDGWHTFDYTLLDFFYADKLLRVGGIIIVDDALHRGVAKFVKYIDTNYPFYKKIKSPKTNVCYQKIKDDDRDWSFHKDF